MIRRSLMVALLGLVATMALASTASAQMVGQWHMDEATTSTPDTSGSNLPLASSTGAAIGIAPGGRFANQLAPLNPSLGAPLTDILRPAQVTLMAWVKLSGPAPALRYIAGLGDDGAPTCSGSSYAMYTGVAPNQGLYFYIRSATTSYLSATPGQAVWDGNWHMVVGTFDGAALHLYVDGVEVGSPTPTNGDQITYALPGQTFYAGAYPIPACDLPGNPSNFAGGIDEVRVYNRALTQNEIARLAAWPGPDAPPALIVDPAPPPPPPPLAPIAKRSVVGTELRGRVLVRLPGTKRFVDLNAVTSLPLGTVVNATAGRISITAAANDIGATQTAVFYDGIFKLGQTGPSSKLTTVLTLFGNEPQCAKPRKAKSKRSSAAAKKRKSRRLWGDGKGRFQTKGQYSSATVRGTKWLVQDNCKGTLTKVAKGSVTVRDFVKDRNVVVKAGDSYLAKRSK